MPDIFINKPQNVQPQDNSNTPPNVATQEATVKPDNSPARVEELRRDLAQEQAKSADAQPQKEIAHTKTHLSSGKNKGLDKSLNKTAADLENKKNGKVDQEGGTFSSFVYMPKKASFKAQEPDEEIVMMLRAHVITNLRWIFIAVIFLLIPGYLFNLAFFDVFPASYITAFTLFWYLVVLSFILENFLGWFFNVNFITDERILDVDFHNLIHKEISTAGIDSIQDVSYTQTGTFQSIFNYGNVFVQTAAEKPRFEFLKVPQPDRVVSILSDLMEQEELEKIEGRVK